MRRNFAVSEQVYALYLDKVYQERPREWNSFSPPVQDEYFPFQPGVIGRINPTIDQAVVSF